MNERTYLDFLADILDCLEQAQVFVAGMTFEDFSSDRKTRFAVVQALEIVGEATKRLPSKLKDRYPNLPWRDMAGMRDKLIHDYFGIDPQVVWETVTEDVPTLEPEIRSILAKET